MSILAGREERGYDQAEELVADLGKLVSCGIIVAVREVGGPTRYCVAPQDGDDGGGELHPTPGAVFSAG